MAGARDKSSNSQPPPDDVPNKLYFKIGEVAQLVGVETHVLRYWEREVPMIRPAKTASNQRRYRRKDVLLFREIKRLLYEERFTLAGARKRLMIGRQVAPPEAQPQTPASPPVAAPAEAQPAPAVDNSAAEEKLDTARAGLRDLIRMSGETP